MNASTNNVATQEKMQKQQMLRTTSYVKTKGKNVPEKLDLAFTDLSSWQNNMTTWRTDLDTIQPDIHELIAFKKAFLTLPTTEGSAHALMVTTIETEMDVILQRRKLTTADNLYTGDELVFDISATTEEGEVVPAFNAKNYRATLGKQQLSNVIEQWLLQQTWGTTEVLTLTDVPKLFNNPALPEKVTLYFTFLSGRRNLQTDVNVVAYEARVKSQMTYMFTYLPEGVNSPDMNLPMKAFMVACKELNTTHAALRLQWYRNAITDLDTQITVITPTHTTKDWGDVTPGVEALVAWYGTLTSQLATLKAAQVAAEAEAQAEVVEEVVIAPTESAASTTETTETTPQV